jgi:hypothetical protein
MVGNAEGKRLVVTLRHSLGDDIKVDFRVVFRKGQTGFLYLSIWASDWLCFVG